jgi:TPR repeat protein
VKIIRSTITDNSNQESKHFKASTKPTFNVQYDEEPESHYNQGLMYHNAKKYNEAFEHFKKAADPIFQITPANGEYAEYINAAYNHIKNGDMTRARQTYNIYKDLTGMSNSGIENCLKAGSLETKDGHAKAQFYLGLYYEEGYGVPQDYIEAVKWYRKAAEQGDADAQCNLGYCYKNGRGVPPNYAEAAKWYRKAAEQGNAQAQYNLGGSYYNGQGVPKDYTEAVKWYLKAAEQGIAQAQFNLGVCYYNGYGVTQNKAEAVKWYRKAAQQGYGLAQEALKQLGETW